jgi:hypothetical protein
MLETVFFARIESGFLISILGSWAVLCHKASAEIWIPGDVMPYLYSPPS